MHQSEPGRQYYEVITRYDRGSGRYVAELLGIGAGRPAIVRVYRSRYCQLSGVVELLQNMADELNKLVDGAGPGVPAPEEPKQ